MFALLFHKPTRPINLDVPHIEGHSKLKLFPSTVTDERTLKLCERELLHINAPIKDSNFNLEKALTNWTENSEEFRRLVSGIQNSTGFRNIHHVYGDILLHVSQIESIARYDGLPSKTRYGDVVSRYGSKGTIKKLESLFEIEAGESLGTVVSELRNDIAHVHRPLQVLNKLSWRKVAEIDQCLALIISSHILSRLETSKSQINSYQEMFRPP